MLSNARNKQTKIHHVSIKYKKKRVVCMCPQKKKAYRKFEVNCNCTRCEKKKSSMHHSNNVAIETIIIFLVNKR